MTIKQNEKGGVTSLAALAGHRTQEWPLSRYILRNAPPRTALDKEDDARIKTALVANEVARVAAIGEGLEQTFFDYATMPVASRPEIQKIVSTIKAAHRRLLADVVGIGENLSRAKELLGHGNFLPWLQAEFRWSERTARNFMALAHHFGGNRRALADLDLTVEAGYALAAKSTPPEIRDELVERAKGGEKITQAKVRERLRETRGPAPAPVPVVHRLAPESDVAAKEIETALLKIANNMGRCSAADVAALAHGNKELRRAMDYVSQIKKECRALDGRLAATAGEAATRPGEEFVEAVQDVAPDLVGDMRAADAEP